MRRGGRPIYDGSLNAGDRGGMPATLNDADKAAMREGGVTGWARESWQASHDFASGMVMTDPRGPVPTQRPVITEEMTQRLIPIVRHQIERGGIRLARVLDEAFAADSVWLRPPARRT